MILNVENAGFGKLSVTKCYMSKHILGPSGNDAVLTPTKKQIEMTSGNDFRKPKKQIEMISGNQKNTNLNDAMLTSQRVRHLLDPTTWIPAASTLRPNQ